MAKKSDSYEDLMFKLESIVDNMDKGQLSLDAAMKNYEEGITICNKLYKILNEAEGKIKILNEDKAEIDFLENGE
jgi:Exonuclease VII small subunit